MEFEEPVLSLRYGKGKEGTEEARDTLRQQRLASPDLPSWAHILLGYPAFAGADCAFVSGSVTQGWGHANSDLDIFVISDQPLDLDDDRVEFFEQRISTADPTMWIAIGEIDQFRADIELWRSSQVEEIIGRFAGAAPSQEEVELGRTEKELLYRLSVGKPLTGEQRWAQWRAEIAKSSFGVWLAENRKLSAEGMLEDATGMLQSGDLQSAALAAREGFMTALEALLAVNGDYSSSRKWLYRRLLVAELPDLTVPEGWAAMIMAGSATDPGGWASQTVELAQRLLLAVERRSL